ncbi:MAG: adenylyltransferase [Micavibrio aeruginosavorus]|uniref:Molybdopterin-synthase adenylyltransferase n=1 Tax=Micavibrio aeruginosavorus TaxID=349221 RepID=A0A2W5PLU4_9BACT|nr:MAG: adenylyltransferase [Micavibrio aeruginosavorus]
MVTAKEYVRFERQIELCGIGSEGQTRIFQSKILLVGAGGLGCPVSAYLVAAGVGQLTVMDDDLISVSNLQRQILYDTDQIKRSKVLSLKDRLEKLNPECKISAIEKRLNDDNAREFVKNHDIVIDGSDNFKTRYLLNEVCYQEKKPLISGAILQYDGQVYVFHASEKDNPCYRCLYPEEPTAFQVPSCTENAILGPVAGVIGTMMATETLKTITNVGSNLYQTVLLYSALDSTFRKVKYTKKANCQTCGAKVDLQY